MSLTDAEVQERSEAEVAEAVARGDVATILYVLDAIEALPQ